MPDLPADPFPDEVAPNVLHTALLPNGTTILVTIFNGDPETIEVCHRHPFDDRWQPPLPLTRR